MQEVESGGGVQMGWVVKRQLWRLNDGGRRQKLPLHCAKRTAAGLHPQIGDTDSTDRLASVRRFHGTSGWQRIDVTAIFQLGQVLPHPQAI